MAMHWLKPTGHRAGGAAASPPDPRELPLRRMQALALALLLLALAGLVLSEWQGGEGGWAWFKAFCEAAAVGALADWFAVVALFRRPLGLPIPHTAIVPASKHRIADNLATFVRDHFLEPASLLRKLSVFDPAERLGHWLSQPEQVRKVSGSARTLVVEGLELLDKQAVRQAIHGFVVGKLRNWDASSAGSDLIALLTRDGRHHQLLDGAMLKLADYLADPDVRDAIADKLVKHARQEWPNILKMVDMVKSVDAMADNLADRLAVALIQEMSEVLSNPEHAVRVQYEAWLQAFIGRLKDDPTLVERIQELKERVLNHPALHDYVNGLWTELHDALKRDLRDGDSALTRHLESGLLGLGRKLAEDPGLRSAINGHVLSGAERLASSLQDTVTHHIAQTVKDWNDEQLVRQIELSVGRDLQFIRLNGTLVGGAVGLTLHGLLVTVGPWLRG